MSIIGMLIQFVVAMLLVICYYKFVELRKVKKLTKKNLPIDLKIFIDITGVDVKKISYNKLMKIVMFVNAFVVSVVFVFTNITDNLILKFLIAIPMILIVFIAVYKLIGYVFIKKGLSGNES